MITRIKEVFRAKNWFSIISALIITFLGLIIFRNWLFTKEWPGGGDVLGWISKAYIWRDFRWFYVWRDYSFGFVEGVALDLKNLLLISLYSICADGPLTVKIFMFGSFLTAGLSIYAFTYRYTRHHVGALFASMIYVLNPWLFSQFTEAHADIVFSYALAPLIFLLLDRMLKTRRPRDMLIFSLGLWVVLTSFHIQYTVIYGIFLGLFALFYVLFSSEHTLSKRTVHSLKLLLPACLTVFLLAAFMFVPSFSNTVSPYLSTSYGYPLEWSYTTSYKNMTDAFILRANEQWGYIHTVDLETGISLPDFPISEFLLLLFTVVYVIVFLLKVDRYTTFFAVSALISIFISKGPNPPFGYTFTWAWFNLPYFSVLRAASRWNAMTAFSHSFFVSILVSHLVSYVRQTPARLTDQFMNVKVKTSNNGQIKNFYVSSEGINRIVRGSRKILRFFSVVLLICIFLSGFLASWFFFNQGLQTYTPPSEYLQPFEWIGTQQGNYKVVTVGSSPYFADPAMTTELGAGHDVGYESYFIDNKPTLQEGGYDPRARDFVNYLQYYVVPERMTSSLSQLLGTFNYRYTVIPSYAFNNTRDFFQNQTGTTVVFNQSSLILESDYSPLIFVANEHAIVLGGLESFHSLLTVDSYNPNKTALIFADQVYNDASTFQTFLNTSRELIMVDSDPMDLAMLSLRSSICWLDAASYGFRSLNDTAYWIQSPDWKNAGKLVLDGYTLHTSGKNTAPIPFQVKKASDYNVWVRIGFGPHQGAVDFLIDKKKVATIEAYQSSESMRWLDLVSQNLTSGSHEITLVADGNGHCDIDAIVVAEPSVIRSGLEQVADVLKQVSGRLIYFWQAEDLFAHELPSEWNPVLTPYEGISLNTEGIGHNISPEGNATASSIFDFEPKYAIDGDPATRWASRGGMPQWLEIQWDSPQPLTGVRILFQEAFAEDYVVQSWDGTQWNTQVDVKGNKQLERFHEFQQPVQTTKIRIYVTSAPAYDLVSIWEFKCYSLASSSQLSASVRIPKAGRYMLGLHVASGPNRGYLRTEIADFSAIVSCLSSDDGPRWFDVGPFALSSGDQTINISAAGSNAIDALVLYSLGDTENTLSVSDLFTRNSTPVTLSYKAINPCTYSLHVRSEGQFSLVFSEAYHPLWKIHVDGIEVSHVVAYSFLNCYLINKTGDFDLTLSFEGQTYANVGVGISVATFSIIMSSWVLKRYLKIHLRKLLKTIRQIGWIGKRSREAR